jgi:hypothetical protein
MNSRDSLKSGVSSRGVGVVLLALGILGERRSEA